MRRVVAVALSLTLFANTGCGLAIVGAIAGGMAIKKRSERKDMLARMKGANALGQQALASGDAAGAMKHYRDAQRALFGYYFKWEKRTKLSALAAEYPEIAATARGLISVHQKQRELSAAAAVADIMLPPSEASEVRRTLHIVSVRSEVVATAPHMYRGMRTQWHGEIRFARHDPSSDTMRLRVVPYTWVRRQTGFRTQKWYDSELRIWRHRLVPVYRNFKLPLYHKAFSVSVRGYNEQIQPGRAATFLGKVSPLGERVGLGSAVPTKILRAPGGSVVWYLGLDV